MISNKCHYALRAMLELAKRQPAAGPATIVEIAEAQHIPARFLEAILRELKQAGLTQSIRGKKGGYALAKPARQITIGDVIGVIEGAFFSPVTWDNPPPTTLAPDVFEPVWDDANAALDQLFNHIHFEELADKARAATMANVLDYSI